MTPFRALCECGWKASGKDLTRLDRRVIRHCEACGGPVEIITEPEARRRCGCVGECQGHLRGTDEWWEATIEMMDDMAAGRPIPEKFIVRGTGGHRV